MESWSTEGLFIIVRGSRLFSNPVTIMLYTSILRGRTLGIFKQFLNNTLVSANLITMSYIFLSCIIVPIYDIKWLIYITKLFYSHRFILTDITVIIASSVTTFLQLCHFVFICIRMQVLVTNCIA